MDKIANMLSSIKNAAMARRRALETDYSRECETIAKILKDKGFLTEVKIFKPKDKAYRRMNLTLTYQGELPILTQAKRVSKPGKRVYKGYGEITKVNNGYGFAIVSTSRGLITDDEARKKKLGGEVICHIL